MTGSAFPVWHRVGALLLFGAACGPSATTEQPPVLVGAAMVDYPSALFLDGVGGTVELRLFVDSAGQVVPDSVQLERSSGHPSLDSAALAAAPRLRYAPGTRNGLPAAMMFVQPIHFRHPVTGDSSP
jgi:TonB family protein